MILLFTFGAFAEEIEVAPIDMLLVVEPTSDATLMIDIPIEWISFEVNVPGWPAVQCSDIENCGLMLVSANPFQEELYLRFTVTTVTGALQHWQTVPCIDVPSAHLEIEPERSLPFPIARRRWR
jgi:hypothetical protein